MSQAESLLSSLTSNATTYSDGSDVDEYLIIDSHIRSISIPKSIANLGVENDDDVLELKFKMSRYFGDLDLSTFAIRVNYINSQGQKDAYTVSNATVGSNYITFSWLVGPTATKYKGNTSFNVCLKTLNSDGTVDKEFNTTLATLPVLEGLEADPMIVAMYSDIIEQWRQELFGIGDTEEASIRSVSQEEQENIAQKGLEVLATIPEDYTTTFNMIDNADRTKADAIICSSEGEVISVDDSSDDHLRGLRVFGKTTQVTTTGKNLFDVESALQNQKRGTTAVSDYTAYGNGVQVSSNSYDHGRAYMYLSLEAGTYNISANVKVGSSWNFSVKNYDTDTELVNNSSSTDGFISYSFTIDDSALIGFCFMGTVTGGPTTIATDIQLELGTEATSYEPYSGGYVSPSPNCPQELSHIDCSSVTLYGKNMLEPKSNKASGYTAVVNDDGSVTVTGSASTTNPIYLTIATPTTESPLKLTKGHSYYMWGESSNEKYIGTKTMDDAGNSSWSTVSSWNKHVGTEFMNVAQIYLESSGHEIGDTSLCGTYRFQLEVGDEFTGFEAYKESQTINTAYALNGVPVSSGGNYTDSNGQQWICDEVDFERGVLVNRIKSATFTSTYSYLGTSSVDGSGVVFCGVSDYDTSNYNLGMLSTHFRFAGYALANSGALANLSSGEFSYIRNTTAGARVYFAIAGVTSKEEADAWFAENSPTIIYPCLTVTETPLTAEEIEAFKALYSNFHNTTVLNNSGATMQLKYNADTKTYLDNLPKATDAQVQAAVDAWLTAHFSSAEGVNF